MTLGMLSPGLLPILLRCCHIPEPEKHIWDGAAVTQPRRQIVAFSCARKLAGLSYGGATTLSNLGSERTQRSTTIKTAHMNETGINLRCDAGENLPSQAWEMLLDQLRSEHIPGQYPLEAIVCCLSRPVGAASTGPAIATNVRCDERIRVFLQQLANLSAAATRARVLGGSKALCPQSGVITRSASGHARCRAQALSMGQTTS